MSIKRYDCNGRYHNCIAYNGMVFLSGQTATEAGDSIQDQALETLRKIDKALVQYGSDKKNILHVDVYLKSRGDLAEFNAIWDEWVVSGFEPTRACMITELGREPILIEVVVTAVIS